MVNVWLLICHNFTFHSSSDLHFILCELLRDVAVQSEATITTNEIISKVDVALDLHKQLQQSFYSEALCRSLFSLTDLTKLFHRVSSLADQLDSVEDFLLLGLLIQTSFRRRRSQIPRHCCNGSEEAF